MKPSIVLVSELKELLQCTEDCELKAVEISELEILLLSYWKMLTLELVSSWKDVLDWLFGKKRLPKERLLSNVTSEGEGRGVFTIYRELLDPSFEAVNINNPRGWIMVSVSSTLLGWTKETRFRVVLRWYTSTSPWASVEHSAILNKQATTIRIVKTAQNLSNYDDLDSKNFIFKKWEHISIIYAIFTTIESAEEIFKQNRQFSPISGWAGLPCDLPIWPPQRLILSIKVLLASCQKYPFFCVTWQ